MNQKDWLTIMLYNSDYKYFKKARNIAAISDYIGEHIGCVAVYKNKIVGVGCNLNKTHPTQKFYNKFRSYDDDWDFSDSLPPKLHAEINCLNQIRHLNINFSKVKLYIYRIRHDRPFGLARPCPSCMAAIKDIGIKHVYYTTNSGFAYEYLDCQMKGSA